MSKSKRSKQPQSQARTKPFTTIPVTAVNSTDLQHALLVAERYNDEGQAKLIPDLLSPFECAYPFPDKTIRGNYNRLLAYGYAHNGRFLDSEKVVERGLSDYPEALDFLYALCFVKLSLREYSAVIDAGEKFIAAHKQLNQKTGTMLPFSGMAGHLPHVYNYVGSAYLNQGKLDVAREYFQKAIIFDKLNHLPYLNLASLYMREKNFDAAKEIILSGLKNCTQVHELRILAESLKHKATISACLMVKNEEEMLPGCLESIRDWVDEIIVVDTGSTDRTVEIAKSYGAQIYHHEWDGSFSKSRNFTLQYATKDWVFIIDADERVFQEDVAHVLKAVNLESADVITVNVYNVYAEYEDAIVFLPSHRFIRRELSPRYEGIVHNQLVLPASARYVRTGVRIKHLGYGLSPEKMKLKAARTRALLEKQLEADPNNTFALFNYAQLLRSGPEGFQQENAPIIIKAASRAVELTGPSDKANRHVYLMCLDQLAWTYYYTGNYAKALEYSTLALRAKPDYLDPLLLHGYIFFQKKDLKRAGTYFEKYLKAQAAYDPSQELENIILIHLNGRVDALFNLGAIAELAGDIAKAKEHYREALKVNDRYPGANLNLGRLLLNENNLAEAEHCFSRLIESGKATLPVLLGLAQIYRGWGNSEKCEEVLKRALQIDPDSVNVLTALGDIYLATGRYDNAISVLQSAFDRGPISADLTSKLGDAFARVGQFAQAIEIYLTAERNGITTAVLFTDLANCFYRTKDFTAAEKYYGRALELDPQLTIATRNLGLTKAQLHQPTQAIELLERYLAICPEHFDLEHVVADLQAGHGDFAGALIHYERYLQHRPVDPGALFRLSECYLNMGHRDSAIVGYRRTLEIDPSFRPAQERLAELDSSSRVSAR